MHYHYDRFLEVFGMEKLTEILANEAGCFEASLLRTMHTSLTERVYLMLQNIGQSLRSINPEMTSFHVSRELLSALTGGNSTISIAVYC
jgi:hypothetical protein